MSTTVVILLGLYFAGIPVAIVNTIESSYSKRTGMKELKYEIENSVKGGLIERWTITDDDGKVTSYEKKLNTDNILRVYDDRMSNVAKEILKCRGKSVS